MQAFIIKYKKHVSDKMKSNSSMNLTSKVKFGLSFCPLEPMWCGILSLRSLREKKTQPLEAAMVTMENDQIQNVWKLLGSCIDNLNIFNMYN